MGLEQLTCHDPDVVLLSHTLHIYTPPPPPSPAAEGEARRASELARRLKQE
jgi:hypothetical protein